jgi:nitrile hydratase accessory protein
VSGGPYARPAAAADRAVAPHAQPAPAADGVVAPREPAGLPPATELPGLPCDAQGPVFAEPWQAQAFALTLRLHERGVFAWPDWARYLSEAIRDAQADGDPDLGDTYYVHWVTALERLLRDQGIAAPLALAGLRQAWRTAAEATPHGQPVRLNAAARRLGEHREPGAS